MNDKGFGKRYRNSKYTEYRTPHSLGLINEEKIIIISRFFYQDEKERIARLRDRVKLWSKKIQIFSFRFRKKRNKRERNNSQRY